MEEDPVVPVSERAEPVDPTWRQMEDYAGTAYAILGLGFVGLVAGLVGKALHWF